jgi:hypothetical protein
VAQVVAHEPVEQTVPEAQVFAHMPQFALSDPRLTQVPPQFVSPT